MAWDSKSLKKAFNDITNGPKASKFGSPLGEISENKDGDSYERLCPHCYDILEVDKQNPIWGCLNCTKSFIATENIDDIQRVAFAMLSLFGVVFKIALRDGMVANQESKKITKMTLEYCEDDLEKEYQAKIQKSAKKDKYSLEYFSELLFSSFEGKKYRPYREVLYRAIFDLISSDGKLYSYEMKILQEIAILMKFEIPIYEYLYSEMIDSVRVDDAYKILSISKDDSKDLIEEKFQSKMQQYTDEVLEDLHFPKIFVEFAKKHSESLKLAYEKIKESK
jgi:DnaJ-domain-containing protein 1